MRDWCEKTLTLLYCTNNNNNNKLIIIIKIYNSANFYNNIIFLFKYHSHPDLELRKSGGRMFFVPSEFEIHYLHMGKENEYMNKISKCVCTSVDVDYGPEGEFKTFRADARGAAPVHYKMAVSFTELELMTKDKIYKGY